MGLRFLKIFISAALIQSLNISVLHSQDVNLSQYYASPLLLNSANTGNFKGDWRFVNNIRNQWMQTNDPFQTILLSYDRLLPIKTEVVSAGLLLLNDKAGSLGYNSTQVFLSASIEKFIGKNLIRLGLQPGFVMRSYNYGRDITFPSQYDITIGDYNSEQPINEPNLGERTGYFDLNIGIIAERRIRSIKPVIGLSLFHLNRPAGQIAGGEREAVPIRQLWFVETDYELRPSIILTPRYLYMRQSKVIDQRIGSNIKFKLPHNRLALHALYTGAYIRSGFSPNAQALVLLAGLEIRKFDIGFSYDSNIAAANKPGSFRGAIEFSLIYRATRILYNRFTIPCDRI